MSLPSRVHNYPAEFIKYNHPSNLSKSVQIENIEDDNTDPILHLLIYSIMVALDYYFFEKSGRKTEEPMGFLKRQIPDPSQIVIECQVQGC
jgi:hypothetical protein